MIDLTGATRDLLAPVCRDCVWWQCRPGKASPPGLRRSWERAAEDDAGFFGRALLEDDAVIGWMHTAAARLLPRARYLPAGPPSDDAYVLTCSYFYDEQYLRGFQYLLQEIEASLKHRRVAALEAFALRHQAPDEPFRGYLRERNLFHCDVLERNGFRPVKAKGKVSRYRLDLAAVVALRRQSMAWEHVDAGAVRLPV